MAEQKALKLMDYTGNNHTEAMVKGEEQHCHRITLVQLLTIEFIHSSCVLQVM